MSAEGFAVGVLAVLGVGAMVALAWEAINQRRERRLTVTPAASARSRRFHRGDDLPGDRPRRP